MTMGYRCYLMGQLMPQTPGKLTVKVKGKNKTLELLNEGEINFLRAPGLTEITLPLVFPMLSGSRGPDYYLGLLEKAKTQKRTTQFILTRTSPGGGLLFDTNLTVSVEDYTVTENAVNGLDLHVDVVLKQYRSYGTTVLKLKDDDSGEKTLTVTVERPSESAPKESSYTVKKGDTLWAIAKKYLGNGAKYSTVYNANKSMINNPNYIYPGQKLVIPMESLKSDELRATNTAW